MKDNKIKTNIRNIAGAIKTASIWLSKSEQMGLKPRTVKALTTLHMKMKEAEGEEAQNKALKSFHRYLGVSATGGRTKRLKKDLVGFGERGAYGVIPRTETPSFSNASVLSLRDIVERWTFIRQKMMEFDVMTKQLWHMYGDYADWSKRFLDSAELSGLEEPLAFKLVQFMNDRIGDYRRLADWLKENDLDIMLTGDIVGQCMKIINDKELDNKKMKSLLYDLMTTVA